MILQNAKRERKVKQMEVLCLSIFVIFKNKLLLGFFFHF